MLLDVDKQQQQQQDKSESSKSSSRSIVGRGGGKMRSATGTTGSNCGSGNLKAGRPVAAPPRQRRGKVAPTAAELRQTTLTQIDFVQRIIPPPDDELELELEVQVIQPQIESEGKQQQQHQCQHQHQQNKQNQQKQQVQQLQQKQQQQSHVPMEPPKKRRKVAEERAKPDVLTRHDSSFKLATLGPGKQTTETSSSFELDLPVFHENERLGHELAQRLDEDADLGSPRTPKHKERTIVPSSQSPDVTPLSIRTGRRSKNTSPIKSPPMRNRHPTISPKKSESQVDNVGSSKRFHVRRVVFDQENQSPRIKSEDLSETEVGDKIRPLRLFSPRRSPSSRWSRQNKLEASPNAPTQKPKAQKLKKQGSMGPPRNRPPAQVPSSQATTEDPSEVSSPAETRASARRPKQVPSSQASTQDPSQPSQGAAQAPSSKLAASASAPGIRIKTPESSSPRAPLGRVASRVHSSQATTVIEPLSSSAEAEAEETTPRPRKGKSPERQRVQVQTGNPRSPPPAPTPISSPAPAGWHHSQWQWDGKEVTDSQLLPDSLMNWSIPFPSSLSSQGSVGSVGSATSLPTHEDHEMNDRPERNRDWDRDGSTAMMKRGGQIGNQNQAGQAGRGRSKRAAKGASPELQVRVKEEDVSDNELIVDDTVKMKADTKTKGKTKKGAKTSTSKKPKSGRPRKQKSPGVPVKEEPTTD